MSYRSAPIASVLPRINRDLFIPSIQRPYVWQPEQILRLLDSLMQKYPISSFLFWDLAPESRADWQIYRFISDFRHGGTHNELAVLGEDTHVTLVLDGQQRLTSLLIGLHGSYTVKHKHKRRNARASWSTQVLYIDLAHAPEVLEDDDDEASPVDLRYCFRFFEEASRPTNAPGQLWFQVGLALTATDEQQRDELIGRWIDQNSRLEPDAKAVARATLLRLWQALWQDDAIAYYTETSQSYDKVLDIFIRANDGGTKLSRSDLLMSVIDLRWRDISARREIEHLLDELTRIAEPPRALEREFILRSCLFFCDLDFGFKLANFSPANIARIEQHWPDVKAALLEAATLLRDHGIYGTTLASHNVLMLVGYYVFRHRHRDVGPVSEADAKQIRHWAIALVFHGLLALQTPRTFGVVRQTLREAARHGTDFPSAALATALARINRPIDFSGSALDRYCVQSLHSAEGAPLLSLLYGQDLARAQRRPEPLVQARFLDTQYLRAAGVQEAWIVPTQELADGLQLAVALTDEERTDYYARDFEDWIATRLETFFADHHLPTDRSLYRLDRLLDLAQARRERLAEVLQGHARIGDASQPAPASEPLPEDTVAIGGVHFPREQLAELGLDD